MKKSIFAVLLGSLIGMAIMFAWNYFLDKDGLIEALSHSVLISGVLPVLWIFGIFAARDTNARLVMRPWREVVSMLVIIGIFTVAAFLLYYFGTDTGLKMSLLRSLLSPVVMFVIAGIIYIILGKRKS